MKLGELLKKYTDLQPFLQPDPHEEARDIVARLCKKVREKGIWVYEVAGEDKIEVYWKRGRSRVKVYETHYKRDNYMLELEVTHILSLVMQADRLLNEGLDKKLVFSLLRKTIKKTFHRKLPA